MEYIREGSTLPVPFNIIPTLKNLTDIFNAIRRRFGKTQQAHPNVNTNSNNLNPILNNETRRISMGGSEITYNVSVTGFFC
jgi:hypothetical protein